MSIDGFLQFLGLIIAAYALLTTVGRYRLQLLGWRLWLPSVTTLFLCLYLLMFNFLGVRCGWDWCRPFELDDTAEVPANVIAFLLLMGWLGYVALLSKRKSISVKKLPLLARLINQLTIEKRFSEIAELVEDHIGFISQVVERRRRLTRSRSLGNSKNDKVPELIGTLKDSQIEAMGNIAKLEGKVILALQWLGERFPLNEADTEAAQQILRVLHTNDALVEFFALERPLTAIKLMTTSAYDFDYSDRCFEIMIAHSSSQLRRETMLNHSLERGFYRIDSMNPLIHALFADASVVEKLEAYRPIGNSACELIDRNIDSYRQTLSASKPTDDRLISRDQTAIAIRFFDIMIRSSMRDGIKWHMWLFYYNIIARKILKVIDVKHPDYDPAAEFPNFGYYLIFQIYTAYGDWLRAIEDCPTDSVVVAIESVEPRYENGSILKSTILSMGIGMKHLLESDAPDSFIETILEMAMRDYRDLEHRENGGASAQNALIKSLIAGGTHGLDDVEVARLQDCYLGLDPMLQHETGAFALALRERLAV